MHNIHSSVLCMPLVLHRDSVKLPLMVPQSALLLFFMYISPPNCTPYCQGCDKVHINKAFGTFLEDFFTEWRGG